MIRVVSLCFFFFLFHFAFSSIRDNTTTNNYNQAFSNEVGSATWIRLRHNVLSWITFRSNSLISKSFLIFSHSFYRSSYVSSDLTILYLFCSPYYGIYRSFLYVPKPRKPIFHHLFYYSWYLNFLSNIVISNSISSCLTTHPTQHSHLRYIYFILVLVLHCPTLCSIHHHWYYRCPIKFPFQLEWYFHIT